MRHRETRELYVFAQVMNAGTKLCRSLTPHTEGRIEPPESAKNVEGLPMAIDKTSATDKSLPKRTLGSSGLDVSAIGLGCMSLSGTYGTSDDDQGIAVIREALDRGVTLLDTSDAYGNGHNEELVGKAIKGRRADVILATKFGNMGGRGG